MHTRPSEKVRIKMLKNLESLRAFSFLNFGARFLFYFYFFVASMKLSF